MIRITISPLWAIIYTVTAIAVCIGLCIADKLWVRIALVAVIVIDKVALWLKIAKVLAKVDEMLSTHHVWSRFSKHSMD